MQERWPHGAALRIPQSPPSTAGELVAVAGEAGRTEGARRHKRPADASATPSGDLGGTSAGPSSDGAARCLRTGGPGPGRPQHPRLVDVGGDNGGRPQPPPPKRRQRFSSAPRACGNGGEDRLAESRETDLCRVTSRWAPAPTGCGRRTGTRRARAGAHTRKIKASGLRGTCSLCWMRRPRLRALPDFGLCPRISLSVVPDSILRSCGKHFDTCQRSGDANTAPAKEDPALSSPPAL